MSCPQRRPRTRAADRPGSPPASPGSPYAGRHCARRWCARPGSKGVASIPRRMTAIRWSCRTVSVNRRYCPSTRLPGMESSGKGQKVSRQGSKLSAGFCSADSSAATRNSLPRPPSAPGSPAGRRGTSGRRASGRVKTKDLRAAPHVFKLLARRAPSTAAQIPPVRVKSGKQNTDLVRHGNILCNPIRSIVVTSDFTRFGRRASPHNSARAFGKKRFWPGSKFEKRRNPVWISSFSNCRGRSKDPANAADAIVRRCLIFSNCTKHAVSAHEYASFLT